MRWQMALLSCVVLSQAGCQWMSPRAGSCRIGEAPEGQYVVVSNLENESRPLGNCETVSTALRRSSSDATVSEKGPMSVVLIRRTPEGLNRELINCDEHLRPLDPKQDYILRDGDELVLPAATTATPAGLQRPPLPAVPATTF